MSKNTRNRILLTAVAALLLVVMTVGGTLAWLVDTTSEVKNVFEATGIDIDLKETKNPDGTTDEAGVTNWTAEMIPGMTYSKNPIVSVVRPTTDVDIWLFVKFEDANITSLTYDPTLNKVEGDQVVGDNGWNKGNDSDIPENVYYRKVTKAETTSCGVAGCSVTNPHWHMLANDTVSIAETVQATNNTIAGGELKWTAYAIQVSNGTLDSGEFTAAQAWAALNP